MRTYLTIMPLMKSQSLHIKEITTYENLSNDKAFNEKPIIAYKRNKNL